tara:strand:+ start:614 stop:799 length:186 start_codon:yes stop_codon:yes gene_type:complete
MQFRKKTSVGSISALGRIFIKLIILIAVVYSVIYLIDKIKFPSPNKQIEKIVPNENFKVIK